MEAGNSLDLRLAQMIFKAGLLRQADAKNALACNFPVYVPGRLAGRRDLNSGGERGGLAAALEIGQKYEIRLPGPADADRLVIEAGAAQLEFGAFRQASHQSELGQGRREYRDGSNAAA